jgi:endonuclease G
MKTSIYILLAFALAACGKDSSEEDNSGTVWTQTQTESSKEEGKKKDDKKSSSRQSSRDKDKDKEPEANPAKLPANKQPTMGCERFYVLGKEPKITDPKLKQTLEPKLQDLCYRAFAIKYSGLTRTPIWVAEALNARQIQYASSVSRSSDFKPDPSLKVEDRAELDDFRRSGFDRGHMAPSANMPTLEAQAESFYLSNIVAQNGVLNGGRWSKLEQSVRRLSYKHDVFVITGPIFQNAKQALKGRVLVPTSVFKAIFVDGEGAVVYIAENKAKGQWNTMTIDQFKSVYGIDLYPALPPVVRSTNFATGGTLRPKTLNGESGDGKNKNGSGEDGRPSKIMARRDGVGAIYPIDKFQEFTGRMPREDELVEFK